MKQNKLYLGNKNIKAAGVDIEYTQEQLEEIIKCSQDVEYFIRNYMYIVHVDKGKVKFGLYDCQANLINHINDNRFTVLLSGRQQGKCLNFSTYINIRNTKTGESKKITIGEFYELQKSNSNM